MKFKGLLVACLVVIIALLAFGCKKADDVTDTAEEIEDVPQEIFDISDVPEGELVEVIETPTEVEKCDISTVIAFTGCDMLEDGNVAITFLNSGKENIVGAWYYIETEEYSLASDARKDIEGLAVGYEFLKMDLPRGEIQDFVVDINKWEEKLGMEIRRVTIKPAIEEDGVFSACMNQRKTATISRDCR